MPDSVRWVRDAAEYGALVRPTYRLASAYIDSAAAGRAVRRREATPLPGADVFLAHVRTLGGRTSSRAIATPPFTGGLFLGQEAVDLLSAGPFPIDHDQRLSVHATAGFAPTGPWWLSATLRHDSGLVANPSDPVEVAADPDFADLLPYVNLTSGTPRVRPRTVVDVATGLDFAGARGRRTWGLQVQASNLTNRTALYNFQSVFVGTRLVQPRTVSVRLTRHF